MERHGPIRYIRLTTKERPHDRFLTTQARENPPESDKKNGGSLYFVVEINNPWFPNSQIGQTIINTIQREYTRGQNTSPLINFELALKKTNEVLANITQGGETDWIGNLSSLIALISENHLYLAQTGQARAYLVRSGKVTNLTEGIDEEASQHPLTTYGSIMSGALEAGDRILLASSQIGDTLTTQDIKELLGTAPLSDAARELVRALQNERLKRMNAFVLEYGDSDEPQNETLYLDQSLKHPSETARRAMRQYILPAIGKGGKAVAQHSQAASQWVRSSLIPRTVHWSKQSAATLVKTGQNLQKKAQPIVQKHADNVISQVHKKQLVKTDQELPYQVHHYTERKSKKNAMMLSKAFTALQPAIRALKEIRIPKISLAKLTRQQKWFLGIAVLVLVLITGQVANRRTTQVAEEGRSSALAALDAARIAQQNAERAFVLGQRDSAKTYYAAAISEAKTASEHPQAELEAATIITQSQTILDQLTSSTRLTNETESAFARLDQSIEAIAKLASNKVLVASNEQVQILTIDSETGAATESANLPRPISATNATLLAEPYWYLSGINNTIMHYDSQNQSAQTTTVNNGAWHAATAFSRFGDTIYTLDTEAGQIWKYTPLNNGELEFDGQYFKDPKSNELATATDIAIDGDVYIMHNTGSVDKYTRGVKQDSWAISGIPTPWDKIETPLAIFANADADTFAILEGKTPVRSARLIEFSPNGSFTRQLLFPEEWEIQSWNYDPVTQTGYIAADNRLYEFDWTTITN